MRITKTPLAVALALAIPSVVAAAPAPDPVDLLTPKDALACLKKLNGNRVGATAGNVSCRINKTRTTLDHANNSREFFGFKPLTKSEWDELGTPDKKGSQFHDKGAPEYTFETGGERPTRLVVSEIEGTSHNAAHMTFRRGQDDKIGNRISAAYFDSAVGCSPYSSGFQSFTPNYVTSEAAKGYAVVPVSALSKQDQAGVKILAGVAAFVIKALGEGPSRTNNPYGRSLPPSPNQ
ncbi:MAG: hypothetical protein PHD48_01975 [Alphaproteobacteria bacterium]|nr:hypothetical protein [Alphaproteobacteria bacterium]